VGVRLTHALPLGLGLSLACTAHAPDALEIETPEPEVAALEPLPKTPDALDGFAPDPEPDLDPDPDPDPEPIVCLPEGFAAKLPRPVKRRAQARQGACLTTPKRLRARLRKDVKEQWSFEHEGASLAVRFGCDRLGKNDAIQEIIVQGGAGHGGTLDLTRFARADDHWDVMQLRASSGYYSVPDDRSAGVHRGTVSAAKIDHALDIARAALSIKAKEIPPDPVPFGGSWSSSSADFHSFVRVIAANGRSREAAYTGYMGTSDQETWIPAMLAGNPFYDLLEEATLEPTPTDEASQRFFMRRFAEAEARDFYGEYGWWVRERFIAMAGIQATKDFVPTLAEQMCVGEPDASFGRARAEALESIFAIIGRKEKITKDDNGWIGESFAFEWAQACGVTCPALD
jgi:hypothetical protein